MRALAVLEACAQSSEGVSFKDLRSLCGGMAATTLSRILEPLVQAEYLLKSPETGAYTAGPKVLLMARFALGQASLEERLQPLVAELAQQSSASAAYFHWDGKGMELKVKHEIAENFHYATLGHRQHYLEHTFYRAIQSHLSTQQLSSMGVSQDQGLLLQSIRAEKVYMQEEQLSFPIIRITSPVNYGLSGPIAGSIGITSLNTHLSAGEKKQLCDLVQSYGDKATSCLQNLETHHD